MTASQPEPDATAWRMGMHHCSEHPDRTVEMVVGKRFPPCREMEKDTRRFGHFPHNMDQTLKRGVSCIQAVLRFFLN